MAGRSPVSVNTKKARAWDAKIANARENGICGMERRFGYRPRKVSVEYECQVAILNRYGVEVPVRYEPTEEDRRIARERNLEYRRECIRRDRERRALCLQ